MKETSCDFTCNFYSYTPCSWAFRVMTCYFDNRSSFSFCPKKSYEETHYFIGICSKVSASWFFRIICQLGLWLLLCSLIAKLLAHMNKRKWQEKSWNIQSVIRTLLEKVQMGGLFLISEPGFFHRYLWRKLVLMFSCSHSCIILAD